MKQIGLLLFFLVLSACTRSEELSRLEARAQRVEIIRDDFGVPHIYAETDADAVLECFMPSARMILIESNKIIFGQQEDLLKLKVHRPYIATFELSCS